MKDHRPGPEAQITGKTALTAEEAYDNGYRLAAQFRRNISEGLRGSYLMGHQRQIAMQELDYGYWNSLGFLDGYADTAKAAEAGKDQP